MIFVSGFTGRKWPGILWCLAALFLLLYSGLTVVMLPYEELIWLNLHAVENGRFAWMISLVLMAWPAWRNLNLGAWLFILPLSSSVLLSLPLIKSGKLHQEFFHDSTSKYNLTFDFTKWLMGKVESTVPSEFVSPRNSTLKSLIYLPQKSGSKIPVLFLLHGGGFYQGTPAWMHGWASTICDQGIAVVSVAYPLTPDHKFPSQINEIAATIHDLKASLSAKNIDTNSIFIAGSSAGGTLGLSTALLHPETNVKGIIALYPISDFTTTFSSISDINTLKNNYQGVASDSSISPLFQLKRNSPPLLLMHGKMDNIVAVDQSQRLFKKWVSLGNECQFIELSWASHSFEYPMFGPSGQLLENSTLQFIEKYSKH